MVGSQQIFVLEQTHSVLIAKNTLVFALIILRVFYFSSTAFSSCFSFIFRSELVCFLWQGVIQLSNLYWLLSLRVVSNKLIGVGDE